MDSYIQDGRQNWRFIPKCGKRQIKSLILMSSNPVNTIYSNFALNFPWKWFTARIFEEILLRLNPINLWSFEIKKKKSPLTYWPPKFRNFYKNGPPGKGTKLQNVSFMENILNTFKIFIWSNSTFQALSYHIIIFHI